MVASMKKVIYKCKKFNNEHGPRNCPAICKTCNICKGLNHYAIWCKNNKNVQQITESNVDNTEDFSGVFKIETITKVHSVNKAWWHKIKMNNDLVSIKLDTGAEVNLTSETILDKIKSEKYVIVEYISIIETYGRFKIKPKGTVKLKCEHNGNCFMIEFLMVDNSSSLILRLDNCIKLNLIKKVELLITWHKKKNLKRGIHFK